MPVETADLPRTFTVLEVQRVLRTGKHQVLNLIYSGRLAHFRIGEKGGRIRVSEAALRQFMDASVSGKTDAEGRAPNGTE